MNCIVSKVEVNQSGYEANPGGTFMSACDDGGVTLGDC